VTDGDGATASANLSIDIFGVATASLPNATQGSSYSQTLQAAGGTTPYTWTCSGLPSGLSCSAGGTLSGTPTATGTFSVAVTVTDQNGVSSTRTLSLDVT